MRAADLSRPHLQIRPAACWSGDARRTAVDACAAAEGRAHGSEFGEEEPRMDHLVSIINTIIKT